MQKICVKNFMALKEVEIELQNLALILGEQASGKSTLSKLIYFFKYLPEDLLYVVSSNLESSDSNLNELWNAFLGQIRQRFYNFFGSTRHLPNFESTYSYTDNNSITLSLYDDGRLKVYVNKKEGIFNNQLMTLMNESRRLSKQTTSYEVARFQSSFKKLNEFISNWFNNEPGPLFIPAGRGITVSYPESFKIDFRDYIRDIWKARQSEKLENAVPSVDLFLTQEFVRHTEYIKEKFRLGSFNELIADKITRGEKLDNQILEQAHQKINKILKGDYKHDYQGEKIFYSEKGFVYVNQSSSGQQEAIRICQDIFLILLDNERTFRVIEEPEAHLYPMAQKFLIELMVLMINSNNSQVILTTHSPYILSIVNNLLFARRVANKSQTVTAEIQDIIPESCWLDPDKCVVYFLENGRCQSIINPQTGLIAQNFLDEISEKLGDEFDKLYQIHARSFR